MLSKYTFWLKVFIFLSLLTGAIHSVSLFIKPTATNETEEKLIGLMNSYEMEMGSGFRPTMSDLFTALSSCFTLVYFLGAFVTFYLIRIKASHNILKGITGIQLIIFGTSFILMLAFTFLPPIVLTGLTFLVLLLAYFLNRVSS